MGDTQGVSRQGWVCEKDHPNTAWKSPWDWAGFQTISETSQPADFLAKVITDNNLSAETETQKNLKVRADGVDDGPLLATLKQAIDAQGNKDRKITSDELKKALRQPWLADTLTKLIVCYESEWDGDMSKWDALDPLIVDGESDWQSEKVRIKKIALMNRFHIIHPASPYRFITHLHFFGLLSSFLTHCSKECLVETYKLMTKRGNFTVSKESFEYILESESYQQKPYVPAGKTASGVTIGYGYDLGHQNKDTVRNELIDIYGAETIERLIKAVGLTGNSARIVAGELSDVTISKNSALALATKMKRRYAESVVEVYPQIVALHPHCQGALLSLVINRGTSFTSPSAEPRREMKEIQQDLADGFSGNIPSRIRSMKRIWAGKGLGGLVLRREKEAEFFERGLKCDCWE